MDSDHSNRDSDRSGVHPNCSDRDSDRSDLDFDRPGPNPLNDTLDSDRRDRYFGCFDPDPDRFHLDWDYLWLDPDRPDREMASSHLDADHGRLNSD
jgi:hypothetical protein